MAGANNSFNGGQFDRLKLSVYFDSVDQNSGETVSRYPRHTQKSFRPSPKAATPSSSAAAACAARPSQPATPMLPRPQCLIGNETWRAPPPYSDTPSVADGGPSNKPMWDAYVRRADCRLKPTTPVSNRPPPFSAAHTPTCVLIPHVLRWRGRPTTSPASIPT